MAKASIQRPQLIQKFGAVACLLIEQFDSKNLIQFLWAYEELDGKHESWAKAAAPQRLRTYAFPSIRLEVALSMQVPGPVVKPKDSTRMISDGRPVG